MNVHLLAAPRGFSAGIELMNKAGEKNAESFEGFVLNYFESERQGGEHRATDSLVLDIGPSAVLAMVNALGYILRGCQEQKLENDGVSLTAALATFTEASEIIVACVVRCWVTTSGEGVREIRNAFAIGQLVGLDWKLGLALASSACSQLVAPYATLTFKVKDSNGGVRVKKLELTLSEFKGMSRQLAEVAAKMDRL
mmetsp:Transcript_84439/g.163957  ORF Transcript_84439/g.163957 Transcript_84439/m.163957 type:complete len:197 (-) Transcript_84439:163-753(-)